MRISRQSSSKSQGKFGDDKLEAVIYDTHWPHHKSKQYQCILHKQFPVSSDN